MKFFPHFVVVDSFFSSFISSCATARNVHKFAMLFLFCVFTVHFCWRDMKIERWRLWLKFWSKTARYDHSAALHRSRVTASFSTKQPTSTLSPTAHTLSLSIMTLFIHFFFGKNSLISRMLWAQKKKTREILRRWIAQAERRFLPLNCYILVYISGWREKSIAKKRTDERYRNNS